MKNTFFKTLALATCLAGISYILIDSIRPVYRTEKVFQEYILDENDKYPVVKNGNVEYSPKKKPVYENIRTKEPNLPAGIMAGLTFLAVLILIRRGDHNKSQLQNSTALVP